MRMPDSKNGRKRNLPFWGLIEEHLKSQKAYRDQHHPECPYLFFWRSIDVALARGGVRSTPGSPIEDFRASWAKAIKVAHAENPRVPAKLLVHDLRRSAVRVMIQEAGLPESQAMLISGHETPAMLHRYNIVSLRNVQDAGAKLDAWANRPMLREHFLIHFAEESDPRSAPTELAPVMCAETLTTNPPVS